MSSETIPSGAPQLTTLHGHCTHMVALLTRDPLPPKPVLDNAMHGLVCALHSLGFTRYQAGKPAEPPHTLAAPSKGSPPLYFAVFNFAQDLLTQHPCALTSSLYGLIAELSTSALTAAPFWMAVHDREDQARASSPALDPRDGEWVLDAEERRSLVLATCGALFVVTDNHARSLLLDALEVLL